MYVRDDGNLGFPVVAAVQAAAAVAGMLKKKKKPKLSVASFAPQPAYGTPEQMAAWFQDFSASYNSLLAHVRGYKSGSSKAGSIRDMRAVANQLGVQTADDGSIVGFPAAQGAPAPSPSTGVVVAPPPPATSQYQPEMNAQPAPQFPPYPYPYPPPPPPPPPPADISQWAMPLAVVVAAIVTSRRRGD